MIDLGGVHPFQGEEYRPFFWEGGRSAAVLVHGFPGTPAEMRPVAAALHQAGWTVQALLLPGFGADIATLDERRHGEWVAAVDQALAGLAGVYAPVALIGYSVGAAVALCAAANHPPSGLVLLAPFWRLGNGPQRLVWAVLKRFRPTFAPFKQVDFDDPKVRQAVEQFLPGLNLDDPALQQAIRVLRVPARLADEVLAAGRAARHAARRVTCPTLIIQGCEDEVVRPALTRRLVRELEVPVRTLEVSAGHDLLDVKQPAWPQVVRSVVDFARGLEGRPAGATAQGGKR